MKEKYLVEQIENYLWEINTQNVIKDWCEEFSLFFRKTDSNFFLNLFVENKMDETIIISFDQANTLISKLDLLSYDYKDRELQSYLTKNQLINKHKYLIDLLEFNKSQVTKLSKEISFIESILTN